MTKAFLLNAARYLTGTTANDTLPSQNQGMGEMNLGTAFDGTPRILRDELAADLFTASGQTRTYVGTISDPAKPFRVTVAWTDAPGNTTGNAYNNDLDLTVTIGGNTYKGNVFSGAVFRHRRQRRHRETMSKASSCPPACRGSFRGHRDRRQHQLRSACPTAPTPLNRISRSSFTTPTSRRQPDHRRRRHRADR